METNILIFAVSVLAGAGAFSAVVGWLRDNEAFQPKKFALGVLTGIFGGIALTLANATGILNSADLTSQIILIGSLALSIVGIDTLRTAASSAIANRAQENIEGDTE